MSVTLIDGIKTVVFHNGIVRIDTFEGGPNNEERLSGTLLVPGQSGGADRWGADTGPAGAGKENTRAAAEPAHCRERLTRHMPQYAAVSRERHANKKWQRYTNFAFAAGEPIAPIVGAELARAALAMPCAFVQQSGRYVLVAVLSFLSRPQHVCGTRRAMAWPMYSRGVSALSVSDASERGGPMTWFFALMRRVSSSSTAVRPEKSFSMRRVIRPRS